LVGRSSSGIKASNGEWVFPDQLRRFLIDRYKMADVVVKKCEDPKKYGLEVWIDYTGDTSITEMIEAITKDLGLEYKPVLLRSAEIRRSSLGKVEQITKR
ncbi:MAG: hypothetical protein V3T30_06520, partial [Thermodesulfobacteriota bacterium]